MECWCLLSSQEKGSRIMNTKRVLLVPLFLSPEEYVAKSSLTCPYVKCVLAPVHDSRKMVDDDYNHTFIERKKEVVACNLHNILISLTVLC